MNHSTEHTGGKAGRVKTSKLLIHHKVKETFGDSDVKTPTYDGDFSW